MISRVKRREAKNEKLGNMCQASGCVRGSVAKSLCDKHYARFKRWGDPNKLLQCDLKGLKCSEENCERNARKVNLCNVHYTKKWMRDNPERSKNIARQCWFNRTSYEKGAKGKHTRQEWEELLELFGGLCAYCKVNKATDRDHVIPISKGGSNEITNILPACDNCNSRKHSKNLEDWLNLTGFNLATNIGDK
jgi:5-methylcytosine-specific restriction endonuclease McrA